MGFPRSKYIRDGQEIVCHCYTRCVRRGFLCGFDALTQRDFSHRKAWIVERMRFLATIFAIEVCAYSILHNHYHLILRLLPNLVASWSDRDVAIRWLTLFPHRNAAPTEIHISALTACPERIAQLRRRLSNLSWFMGRLNEFIARKANKEEDIKGRFWESRFKCKALLDEAAIVAGMVYVDLNPIRAGLAATPEESDFTSIQERIRAWRNEIGIPAPTPGTSSQEASCNPEMQEPPLTPDPSPISPNSPNPTSSFWLCPIQSDLHHSGILPMSTEEYFDLVDRSGRILRADKRGAIDPHLAPILLRIGINPNAWLDTISRFDARFRLAAGLLSSLRAFADQLGRRWVLGVTAAKTAFST